MKQQLLVPAGDAGTRLDTWLEDRLDGVTRSLITRLIKEERVQVEPGKLKPGLKLKGGETITVDVPEVQELHLTPEHIPLSILYEDDDLLLLDKPQSMVVHPGPGHPHGSLLSGLLGLVESRHARGEPRFEPALIHRLDEDTSGVIAVAKHAAAHTAGQESFAGRLVKKRYLALIHGAPRADVLENKGAMARHPRDFRKRCVVPDDHPGAKPAHSTVIIRQRHDGYCVAEVRPITGRTHQVRVHCADLGHAVLADKMYSRAAHWPPFADQRGRVLRRQGLHAWHVRLPHPAGGAVEALSSIPADLATWVEGDLRPIGIAISPGSARRIAPGDED